MQRCLIATCFLLSAQCVSAQYFQFSQYNFAAQRTTPTAPANSDYAQLSFIYRNQTTGGDFRLKSNMISASYPILNRKTGRRWSGVGVTLMDDRSGGIYKTTEGSLSYAVNVFLSESQSLSLGFKGLYQQRKIDISGLYTGSQFVPDRGFEGYISSGEDLGMIKSAFISLSTGLSWQQTNKDGIRTAYLSCSLFDFNRPDDSSINGQRLNSTIVTAGGFRLLKKNNLSVFPEVLYTRGAGNNVVNAGIVTRCDVKATRGQKAFYVDLITKYVTGRSGVFGMQFQNENFSFGVSYDVPIHNNAGNLGAFEIALEFKQLVAASLKNKMTKGKTPNKNQAPKVVAKKIPVKKPERAELKSDTVAQKIIAKKNLTSTLEMKRDSVVANAKAGRVSHDPFVLDKVTLHFNFKFNSIDLDETSTQYLDDLATALQQNEHLKIRLTGHTDNVGSERFNSRLSLHRANTIKAYIVSKGIDAARIDTDGKGMSEPLNDNKTEEDRAKNRRVELTILYKQ